MAKLWSSAVIYLNIQPSDAWQLTPNVLVALGYAILDKMEQSTGKAYTRPMSKTEFERIKRLWTAYMATTDDLVISIRADVGRLESQFATLTNNLAIQRGKVTRLLVLLKVWHCSF